MENLDFDDALLEPGWEEKLDSAAIEKATRDMLVAFGEDPEREGLVRTPQRVARMYAELLAGYRTDPGSVVNGAIFEVRYDEMVIVRDIEFYSFCLLYTSPSPRD